MKRTYVVKKKGTANSTLKEIFKGYYTYATPQELKIDWIYPAIISGILFIILGIFTASNTKLFNIIYDFNSSAVGIMAILAGFNTASLTVMASSNKETLSDLYHVDSFQSSGTEEKQSQNKLLRFMRIITDTGSNPNILKITITFFSYAIIIQTSILIIGLLIIIFAKALTDIYAAFSFLDRSIIRIMISVLGFMWATVILHSLFITIRNVSLLYNYILSLGKKDK